MLTLILLTLVILSSLQLSSFSWASLVLICVILTGAKFCASASQLLLLLLCLELFTLVTFLSLSPLLWSHSLTLAMTFSFFTLAVCEASLGLSLLIRSARSSGDDLCSL